jgi:long-chain acyl-CoA synthetase
VSYQSLAELFVSQVHRYRDRVLYRYPRGDGWQSYTWDESLEWVREIALGLVSLGIKKGDRVAIYSANRVEWSLIDWANICIGALTVPVYASCTPADVGRLLEHSESTLLFVDTPERWAKQNSAEISTPLLRNVILIDSANNAAPPSSEAVSVLSLDKIREMGRQHAAAHKNLFDQMVSSLRPQDDLTIVYTSGTSGEPKGVLTTHGHYLFMVEAAAAAIPSIEQEVTLQFLPFAHSFGRLEHFMVVAKGYTCGFARSMETLARDFLIIRPTLLFSVPRIYENVYSRIKSRAASGRFLRRLVFRWALSVGKRFSRRQIDQSRIAWGLRVAHSIAHRLVFAKIHQAFGGRLRLAISGSAPLAPEIAEFFHTVGILVLEGYGLTETSTVSHVNRAERYRFGTVGFPLDGVDCRIASDGEILLRGQNIFKGYYRDPKGTQDVLDPDGWFHTMDVGEIDQDGFLRITDRKKDLIVTSGGKKIAPQMIENLLKTDPLFSQVMVLGDRSSHLIALVTLNGTQVMEWARQQGLKLSGLEEAATHPKVIAFVRDRIRQKNKGLASFEAIRDFRILPHDFTLGEGELTPTLKLRRQIVMEHWKEEVEDMTRKRRMEL